MTVALAGTLAAVVAVALIAGGSQAADYKGTKVCTMCHKGTHKPIVSSYEKTVHPKAMQKAKAIVGDFSSNSAFDKDKVAYVLGTGRTEQAYLDADFQVLPAMWDVKTKAWKPTPAVDGSTQCIGCHTTGYDPATKSFAQLGVGCEACHGPGGDHLKKPSNDNAPNVKKLSSKEKAMVCGQCHSAGKDTSGKYAFPVGYRPGDDLTKAFVDAKPTSPGRNQQYSEWLQSKHGEMGLGCVTCHDPHNVARAEYQLKKPVNDLCMDCHASKIKDMATHAPGAPGDATCATCHMPDGQHTFKQPGG